MKPSITRFAKTTRSKSNGPDKIQFNILFLWNANWINSKEKIDKTYKLQIKIKEKLPDQFYGKQIERNSNVTERNTNSTK